MIKGIFSFTDKGNVREINQDSVYANKQGSRGIIVVADGMGGHNSGEVASATIVKTLQDWWENPEIKEINELDILQSKCKDMLIKISKAIYNKFAGMGEICGSTVVVLIVLGNQYATLWAGDSRIYMSDKMGVTQLTEDDVWENLPEIRFSMSLDEKFANSSFGKLTNAIGARKDIEIHCGRGAIDAKKRFFLCSDGVYKYCSKETLEKELINMSILHGLGAICKVIKREVISSGAGDNYSMVIVDTE